MLKIERRTVCNLNHVEGYTKKQLREMASQYEIISFDLFDTLIMRQVLLSTDVIELTEYRLRERGIF